MIDSSRGSTPKYKPLYPVINDINDPLIKLLREEEPVVMVSEDSHYNRLLMTGGYILEFWTSNLWYAFADKGQIERIGDKSKVVYSWRHKMLPKEEFMMLAKYYKEIRLQQIDEELQDIPLLEGHRCSKCGGTSGFRIMTSYYGTTLIYCNQCTIENKYTLYKSFRFINSNTVELRNV